MFHILWHSLGIMPVLFPGMILWLVNRSKKIRKINELDKYAICLLLVVFLYLFFLNFNLFIKINVFIWLSFILFLLQYIIINWRKFEYSKLFYILMHSKKVCYILILYPLCEEIIYRYFIYHFFYMMEKNLLFYVILSSISFVFSHFFSQKVKALRLFPLAVFESVLFWFYRDIMFCIMIHMAYNILVYLYNSMKFKDNRFFT